MPLPLEPYEVEDLLRRLPLERAPESVWDAIQGELARQPAGPTVRSWRRSVSPLLTAAAVLLGVVGGGTAGMLRLYGAPSRWAVQPLAGQPTVAGMRVTDTARLSAGEWLVTDGESRARLRVGRIGSAEVEPNSRVRLERGGWLDHRLTLERGTLHAVIAAPPRLFFVRTPTALATDLGCAYTLEVDSVGSSRIHVSLGWVELRDGQGMSVVPAGMVARVDSGQRPGSPYPEAFAEPARQALARLDGGSDSPADLDVVLGALHTPGDPVALRQRSALTLWHLLARVHADLRPRVYRRLVALVPPPPGVTREGILGLERPMLEQWRRELSPMWSDEAQNWSTRLLRRLWEWALR